MCDIKETKRGRRSELLWKSGCSAKSMDLALHGVYHRVLLERKKDARLFAFWWRVKLWVARQKKALNTTARSCGQLRRV